jgi:3-deoxy-D-manno-octulosonate 8-phosphate phosphatase (KDO 8-P phosphatase)
MAKEKNKFKDFVLDIDGVFTTGQFLYTKNGKYAKVFGPHDSDGIKLLKKYLNIQTITADHRGFPITKKRIVDDMKLKLTLVKEEDRESWFRKNCDLDKTIYMGDGMYDAKVFKLVKYSIAPANAFYLAKEKANFVTIAKAAEGAVAEACLHILEKFFVNPSWI